MATPLYPETAHLAIVHPVRDKRDELIIKLYYALRLTKIDAERKGSHYGPQASCNKALRLAERHLKLKDHP